MQYKYLAFYRFHLTQIDYPKLMSQSQVPVLVRQAQQTSEAGHCEDESRGSSKPVASDPAEWSTH